MAYVKKGKVSAKKGLGMMSKVPFNRSQLESKPLKFLFIQFPVKLQKIIGLVKKQQKIGNDSAFGDIESTLILGTLEEEGVSAL